MFSRNGGLVFSVVALCLLWLLAWHLHLDELKEKTTSVCIPVVHEVKTGMAGAMVVSEIGTERLGVSPEDNWICYADLRINESTCHAAIPKPEIE
jgi:hypothetical protein